MAIHNNSTYRLYRRVDNISDLTSELGDCFVHCLEDGFIYNSEGGNFTKISNIMFLNRTDVYTGTGSSARIGKLSIKYRE